MIVCSDHDTQNAKLGYIEWFDATTAAYKRGERQTRCDQCHLWYFPFEMKPVEWRPIPSAPGYEASNFGQIRSWRAPRGLRKTPRLRKPIPDKRGGYLNISYIGSEGKAVLRKVHHLVLEAFVGPKPDGLEGRHRDRDVTNNRLDNLSWSTHLENEADKVLHGTSQHGERNAKAKLSNVEASEIRRSKARGCDLAKRYGISESMISRIRNGVRRA